MKRLTWIAVVLFVIIAVTGSTWILRGFYDRIFMYEGHFHITSTASEDYDIEISFPSGQSYPVGRDPKGIFIFFESRLPLFEYSDPSGRVRQDKTDMKEGRKSANEHE